MRRKKDLEKLLPKDSRTPKKKKGQVTATRELLDRLNVIDDLANKFFDTIEKKISELTERIDNLENDFEQVIDAVAQFGKGGTAPPLKLSSRRSKSASAKAQSSSSALSPPSTPSAPTPAPSTGTAPSLPKIGGGAPKIEFKQGPNAPKL